MRDGSTKQLETKDRNAVFSQFISRFQASIVILNGPAKGTDYTLDAAKTVIGRGPGVDLAFEDDAMSREHASLEFSGKGFQISDLGSTNGIQVNGAAAKAADLKHGDKFQVGEHLFQFVVEQRSNPTTHVVSGD